MKYIKLSIVCFLAFGLTQCKTGKPDNFDYGTIEDNTYTNSFFEMSMNLPEGWAVQSAEAIKQMTEIGSDAIAGDDAIMKAKLKVSEINSANLMSIFRHEVGTPLEVFNANVTLIAENLVLAPGVKEGSDYLAHTKTALLQTGMNYTIDDDFGTETFGRQSFDYMDATLSTQGMSVQQRYYSTIINGFSLTAIISYGSEEQKEMLIDVLASMNFH